MFSLFTFPKTGFSIKEHFLHTMHESTYIVLRLLQVNKSQKLFFLKLHYSQNERNTIAIYCIKTLLTILSLIKPVVPDFQSWPYPP